MIDRQIVFIGYGNMATAIVRGILKYKVAEPDKLSAIKTRPTKNEENIRIYTDISAAPIHNDSIIVLCIKPQIFIKEKEGFKSIVGGKNLILSAMAGISSESISSVFGPNQSYIRCMPNTPCLLGKGYTAYWTKDGCDEFWINQAEIILGSIGIVQRVLTEDTINKVTAFSGSGPGYFFYIVECMINAAIEHGFSEENAKTMITQTIAGASMLLEKESGNAGLLKNQITSKGGTTEAALQYMQTQNVDKILAEALNKAYLKSIEISSRLT